jgi:hypothetical protein
MITPNWQTRRTLLRVLYESASGEGRKAYSLGLEERLGLPPAEFEPQWGLHTCGR